MKTAKIIKTGNHKKRLIGYGLLVYSLSLVLLLPGALIGANIPSMEDVTAGKASLPTIADLTGGKVKIGDLVDKSNVELVKEYLTAHMYELVKRGMVLRMGTTLPPDQLYPKTFKDATLRNWGKAVMDKNGVVYYEKIGTLWPGGIPFPNAKSGLEAMGNFTYGRPWDSFRTAPITNEFVNSKGEIYKTLGMEHYYVKCSGRISLPPLGTIPGLEDVLIKRVSAFVAPREAAGLGQFTVRHYDFFNTDDKGFSYVPAFKRTTKASSTTWQDNSGGGDAIAGDGEGFQEPYNNWDLKLLGKKWLLVNEPKSPTPMLDEKGNLSKNVQFDVGKKYPRLGWVIYPVNVVEAIPRFKHVYGKRVVYLPEWPYIFCGTGIVATDIYDRQMKLWKGYLFLFGRHEYLDGDPQKAVTPYTSAMTFDLQADHQTRIWSKQSLNFYISPDQINLGTLLKMGR